MTRAILATFSFASHIELRLHVQSDHHKLNLRRKLKRKPPLNEAEFENAVACLSDGSLSGSEVEDSDPEESSAGTRKGNSTAQSSVKLQFKDPSVAEGYIIVYKVALPDETSLRSFARRGSWAVIMTGGGHFSAAIWDSDGKMLKHKSFHRYTTRRKQGGSQAIADAGSGGSRIKSAGSNLRRYGEQALRQEVHQLLISWEEELLNVQCVFIRSSKRDKKVRLRLFRLCFEFYLVLEQYSNVSGFLACISPGSTCWLGRKPSLGGIRQWPLSYSTISDAQSNVKRSHSCV